MKPLECGRGDPENAPGRGKEAAGQLASAPRPLPTLCPHPLDSVRVRSDPIRGLKPVRGQVGWLVLPTRFLWVSRKPAEGCTLVVVRFVLVTARPGLDQRLPPLPARG